MNTKWPRNSNYQIFQNPTKIEFQLYQCVELDERIEFDTSIEARGRRSRRKFQKTRRKPKSFFLRFSLQNQRFGKLRPWMNSPHWDEAKGTRLSHRRGRNQKVTSALPLLLSSDSLLSGVAVTSCDHRWTRRAETKKTGSVRRHEVAGIGNHYRSCQSFSPPFPSPPTSACLATTTAGFAITRGRERDRYGAVKRPDGGDGSVRSRQRREGKPRGASGLFIQFDPTFKLNPTIQIKRWFDQWLRSSHSISYFLKTFSLISKLPKIKTNSSGIRKIPWKILRTRNDVYFLIVSSKIKFVQLLKFRISQSNLLKRISSSKFPYKYCRVEFFNNCFSMSLCCHSNLYKRRQKITCESGSSFRH